MPTEVELKLRLPPESVVLLQRNPLLKSLSISRPSSQKLYTVYYDTPDFALRRNDIAFRLRRARKHWVQAVKGRGNAVAGLHQRYEWEAPVLKAQPDFTRISDPSLIKLFDNARLRKQMRPLFVTEFKRDSRILRLPDGGEAELCLDRGKIVAGDASLPFCEIELELKSGNPLPLFRLALDLLPGIPFRLENMSKAERGYTLASGYESPPLKAKPVQLVAEMNICEAIKAIVWNCLGHLHSNEEGMLKGGNMEYLHQMRIALRRLGSALSDFSKAFPMAALNPMIQELQWLTRQLGSARDWDVFVTDTLRNVSVHFPGHSGMLALQEKCEQVRLRYHNCARDAVESARYTELMLKLAARFSAESPLASLDLPGSAYPARTAQGSDDKVEEFAGTLLAHRHCQLKKNGKKLAKLSGEELHALRITIKKQQHVAEFFAGLYSHKKAKRYIKLLRALQAILGKANDAAVTERLLRELPASEDESDEQEAVGIVRGWAASLASTERRELDNAWARFNRSNPFWQCASSLSSRRMQ